MTDHEPIPGDGQERDIVRPASTMGRLELNPQAPEFEPRRASASASVSPREPPSPAVVNGTTSQSSLVDMLRNSAREQGIAGTSAERIPSPCLAPPSGLTQNIPAHAGNYSAPIHFNAAVPTPTPIVHMQGSVFPTSDSIQGQGPRLESLGIHALSHGVLTHVEMYPVGPWHVEMGWWFAFSPEAAIHDPSFPRWLKATYIVMNQACWNREQHATAYRMFQKKLAEVEEQLHASQKMLGDWADEIRQAEGTLWESLRPDIKELVQPKFNEEIEMKGPSPIQRLLVLSRLALKMESEDWKVRLDSSRHDLRQVNRQLKAEKLEVETELSTLKVNKLELEAQLNTLKEVMATASAIEGQRRQEGVLEDHRIEQIPRCLEIGTQTDEVNEPQKLVAAPHTAENEKEATKSAPETRIARRDMPPEAKAAPMQKRCEECAKLCRHVLNENNEVKKEMKKKEEEVAKAKDEALMAQDVAAIATQEVAGLYTEVDKKNEDLVMAHDKIDHVVEKLDNTKEALAQAERKVKKVKDCNRLSHLEIEKQEYMENDAKKDHEFAASIYRLELALEKNRQALNESNEQGEKIKKLETELKRNKEEIQRLSRENNRLNTEKSHAQVKRRSDEFSNAGPSSAPTDGIQESLSSGLKRKKRKNKIKNISSTQFDATEQQMMEQGSAETESAEDTSPPQVRARAATGGFFGLRSSPIHFTLTVFLLFVSYADGKNDLAVIFSQELLGIPGQDLYLAIEGLVATYAIGALKAIGEGVVKTIGGRALETIGESAFEEI
ncbi:uncharacterized protein PAC_14275 [Phialocephala subalpina]|uniref:Uncharacterized protein n=1 Tax=Phialocephala subalpina TaxID=576137 RepID=A0A1L7XHF6_9HELO|nr:uncharacterized protein PAC_14275 [Phialocephala subalpina]